VSAGAGEIHTHVEELNGGDAEILELESFRAADAEAGGAAELKNLRRAGVELDGGAGAGGEGHGV
jgi:hypothetical protein